MRIKKFKTGGDIIMVNGRPVAIFQGDLSKDSITNYGVAARAEQSKLGNALINKFPEMLPAVQRLMTEPDLSNTKVDSIIKKDYPHLLNKVIDATPTYINNANKYLGASVAYVPKISALGSNEASLRNQNNLVGKFGVNNLLTLFPYMKGEPRYPYGFTNNNLANKQNTVSKPIANVQDTLPKPMAYLK